MKDVSEFIKRKKNNKKKKKKKKKMSVRLYAFSCWWNTESRAKIGFYPFLTKFLAKCSMSETN